MKQNAATLVLVLTTVLSVIVSLGSLRPPAVAPADSPAESFSAQRARAHLEVIAQAPHGMGTAEHERVRGYLAEQLTALGLETQVQSTSVGRRDRWGQLKFGTVHNVLGRLPGGSGGPAVLLMSHYDSTPASFGAADDGAGVAAILETARALAEGGELASDVILLFTDGEEAGLLGAAAFVDQHPWAAEVAVVLNFEARGSRGPTLMFETSPGNGRLIREMRRSGIRPVASSYSDEVYRRMPNDTDFTLFRRAGVVGYNFAFIHGPTAYHSSQDTLENLDLRSLQHHGEAALGLTRHLASSDLAGDMMGRDAVFFHLGPLFLSYPAPWAVPLAGLLALATILALWRMRGALSAGGLALALGAHLLSAVLVGGVLYLLAGWLIGFYDFTLGGGWSSRSLALSGLALLGLALTLALHTVLRGKLGAGNLLGAGLILWLLLAAASSFLVPGASYLFAVPLLGALVAAVAAAGRSEDEPATPLVLAALVVAGAAAALVWPSTLALVGVALGGLAAPLAGVVIVLAVGALLAPLASPAAAPKAWLLPVAGLAVLGLVVAVGTRLASGFSADNPRPHSLFYLLDKEEEQARWLSVDRAADAWTAQFLTSSPQRGTLPPFLPRGPQGGGSILEQTAPLADLGGARVEVVDDYLGLEGRTLELNVSWPFAAQRAVIFVISRAEIRAISMAGEHRIEPRQAAASGQGNTMGFQYFAPPAAGIPLRVELAWDEPLELKIYAQRYGLPELPGFTWEPRPAHLMPRLGWASDSTFVRSTATIIPGAGEDEGGEGEGEGAQDADAVS